MDTVSLKDVVGLLANRYADKPDDFVLSIGHHELPFPNEPLQFLNLPEFYGYMSLTMGQIRQWHQETRS